MMEKSMFLLTQNDGLGRDTVVGLFFSKEAMLRYESAHPKSAYEQWEEKELPIADSAVPESVNELVRGLMMDEPVNPCDWCAADECLGCCRYGGNDSLPCRFSLGHV